MQALPKLSIVIPSYNQGRFIERTIRSIVEQNYPNLELILMDGGSTDDTMAIVARYREHFAHVESAPDGGQAAAIAKGFALATGDFLGWLNSDDTYVPGSLVALGTFIAENPEIQFIYGDNNQILADDSLFAYKKQPEFNLGVMMYAYLTVPQVSAFWRRSLYEKVGGLDASFRFCMDYDLFLRMAKVVSPVHSHITIGNFRLHGESKTSTLELVRQAEDRKLQMALCSVKPDQAIMYPLIKIWYKFILAWLFLKNGSLWDRLIIRMKNNMKSACS